jgi:hypothetical protein
MFSLVSLTSAFWSSAASMRMSSRSLVSSVALVAAVDRRASSLAVIMTSSSASNLSLTSRVLLVSPCRSHPRQMPT